MKTTNDGKMILEILEKILKKPIQQHVAIQTTQALCLAYLAGGYQEWENEIKLLAKTYISFLKELVSPL